MRQLTPQGQLPTVKAWTQGQTLGFHHPYNDGSVGQSLPFKPGGTQYHPQTHTTHSLSSPLWWPFFKKACKMYSILRGMTQNCNWDDSIISVGLLDNRHWWWRFIKSHSRYSLGNDLQVIKSQYRRSQAIKPEMILDLWEQILSTLRYCNTSGRLRFLQVFTF